MLAVASSSCGCAHSRIGTAKLFAQSLKVFPPSAEFLASFVSRHPETPIRAKQDGWPRAICDYLAGMTDRYAIQEHHRIFGLQP